MAGIHADLWWYFLLAKPPWIISLHSICVILGRVRKLALLDQFTNDLF